MKFGNPAFLFGLLLLSVPIIIHLFQFRRIRIVYFTNVRFLKQVQQQSKSFNRLKHLLILASRLLALTFLVLAFARPYLPSGLNSSDGSNLVSIYIDNSFSMQSQAEVGSIFEQARKAALEIANAYKQTDRFILLTNDFEAKHLKPLTKDQLASMIDEIKVSPSFKTLDEVITRQQKLMNEVDFSTKTAFIISDFQKSFSKLSSETLKDTSVQFNWVKLNPQSDGNVSIDSLWFSKPNHVLNTADEIQVNIRNRGLNEIEKSTVSVYINEQLKASDNHSLGADSATQRTLSFISNRPGYYSCYATITDYPIVYDDSLFFTYSIAEKSTVYEANGPDALNSISQFFKSRPDFKTQSSSIDNIDFSLFNRSDLVVLNGITNISSGLESEIVKALKNGVDLVLIPGEKLDISSFNKLASQIGLPDLGALQKQNIRCDYINSKSDIFNDVFEKIPDNIDLPNATAYFPLTGNKLVRQEKLVGLQNGESFLSSFVYKESRIYLFNALITKDLSNFSRHGIFAPVLYKMALNSGKQDKLYYEIGSSAPITVKQILVANESTFRIKSTKGNYEFIPEHRNSDGRTEIYVRDQIKHAGIYELYVGDSLIKPIAFNYNRLESDVNYFNEAELNQLLTNSGISKGTVLKAGSGDVSFSVSQLNEGKQLWPIFILLTLLMLVTETLLIRFFKT